MKKALKLSLLIITIFLMFGNAVVRANTSCNLELKTAKNEYKKEDKFIVDFYISNIKSDKGMLALDATLEYDKDSLTLEKFKGQNGWETPLEGASYNKENGKIAIKRSSFGKNNETIFKITFKVNKNAKSDATIALKNVNVADGMEEAKFAEIKKVIEIKENQSTGNQGGNNNQSGNENQNGGTNQSGNANNNQNTNQNNNTNTNSNGSNNSVDKTTTNNKKLPQTGATTKLYFILGGTIAAISMATYSITKIVKNK